MTPKYVPYTNWRRAIYLSYSTGLCKRLNRSTFSKHFDWIVQHIRVIETASANYLIINKMGGESTNRWGVLL